MDKIEELKKIIDESNNIVFFGGAGVSTESNIPDFRSTEGLYSQQYDYPPETMLSHTFFINHPEEFFRFHKNKMIFQDAKPNKAHIKIAELEKQGKLKAVITQNVDGLHQKAGSKNVLELHGSINRNYCMKCGKEYSLDFIVSSKGVPVCECGGIVRPDVVLYEEALDNSVLSRAMGYIRDAEVLIVGGTSLVVYPAAGLIDYYIRKNLVLINKTSTPMDAKADLIITGSIGEIFSMI